MTLNSKLLFSYLESINGQKLESTKYIIIFIFVSTPLQNVTGIFSFIRDLVSSDANFLLDFL